MRHHKFTKLMIEEEMNFFFVSLKLLILSHYGRNIRKNSNSNVLKLLIGRLTRSIKSQISFLLKQIFTVFVIAAIIS